MEHKEFAFKLFNHALTLLDLDNDPVAKLQVIQNLIGVEASPKSTPEGISKTYEKPKFNYKHHGGMQKVIDWFKKNPETLVHVQTLAKCVPGVSRNSVLCACSRGVADGVLVRPKFGHYKLATKK
jgi:hypothetical protein